MTRGKECSDSILREIQYGLGIQPVFGVHIVAGDAVVLAEYFAYNYLFHGCKDNGFVVILYYL